MMALFAGTVLVAAAGAWVGLAPAANSGAANKDRPIKGAEQRIMRGIKIMGALMQDRGR